MTTRRGETYTGDYLVLAAGSQPNFFGTPGAEHAFPLYSLDDAERLQTRIIQAFEEADRDPRLVDEGAIDFVIVGGGPTGVEVAGALSEMINTTMVHEFPALAPRAQGPPRRPRPGAAQDVRRQGPRLRGARSSRRTASSSGWGPASPTIGPGHVTLSDGSHDQDPLRHLGRRPDGRAGRRRAAGCRRAAAAGSTSQPDFTVAGLPGRARHRRHRQHPGQGRQDATRSSARSPCRAAASAAEDHPRRHRAASTRKPFHYLDKGTMAMIGRGAAVAQVKGVELHGKIAFAAWLGVHAALMTGGSNRVDAFKSWAMRLLRQGAGAAGARPERDAPDGLGRGRRGRAGRRGGRDHLTHRAATDDREGIMASDGRYDVIIIGSGAGGGTLAAPPRAVRQADPHPRARRLAAARARELGLEGGLRRQPVRAQGDLVRRQGQAVPAGHPLRGRRRDQDVRRGALPAAARGLRGAPAPRRDLAGVAHLYDDMEPYYTKAEQLYEVHGNHGEDSTEGHASAQYPFPALTHEPRIQQLSDDLERAGYHPFHAPCGVRLLEDDRPNSRCIRCQTCDGFPCLVQAKSDAEMLGVRPALEHTNVTLRTNARSSPGSRPNAAGTAVDRRRGRARRRATRPIDGDIVVVSAGAANSAKILLASANDRHPNGLANGSGQVGRNYMFHNSVAVLAISKEPNPTMFQKTLGLNDFYFGMPGFDYPMGNIQMVGKSDAEMFKGEKPLQTKLAPMFSLTDVATHAVDFWLSTEDLPAPDNRVTLATRRQDPADLHAQQPGAQAAALRPAQVDARSPRACTRTTCIPRTGYLKNEIPIAGCRPPGRDRPLRHGSGDVGPRRRTARPTSSTTCTSSTRASSRASAR